MPDENITVLVLNNVKRVKSFKVNRTRIRAAIIIGVSILSVLVLSLSANFYLYQENRTMAVQLTTGPSVTEQEPQPVLNADENSGESDTPAQQNNNANTSIPESPQRSSRLSEEDIYAADIESDVVDIDNISYSLELNNIELNVSLSLVNKLETNEVVSGYVVIVAKLTDRNTPFLSWPHMQLHEDGAPVDYLKGDRFSIKYLKNVSARILLSNPAERYEYFRISVFDLGGNLLLKKTNVLGE